MTQKLALISIPHGVEFADLYLSRAPDGSVSFNWSPLQKICESSGLDPKILTDQHEDNVAELIVRWYELHRASGGAPDPTAEQLIAEVKREHSLLRLSVNFTGRDQTKTSTE